ncbi:MAG: NADH-quinone oxidoreductase subunit NuoF [Deltaproteobacteria bacterium]|nr:NADH-quinone oxidoreductase subunit NuoF [Deltaproteobacteria bacterium]
MAQEKLLLLKNIRTKGYAADLAAYRAAGGYKALEKVLGKSQGGMTPAQVTEAVKASGLRGRGGAGFPCGLKWTFMPADPKDKPNYLICNGDESEPGTFKDHYLLMNDPHLFLEGMILGCYALSCHHGYIYIRGESMYLIHRVRKAIDELYAEKLLGSNILGSGFDLDLTVHPGAGAYICGEETALLDSLEGKRGQPRFKPPFPAQAGFNGCPTTVNNVETLANVPFIINNGPEAFAKLGTEGNSGTQLVSISGHVQKPGVYEVEMGHNLKSLIEDFGGGVRGGLKLKAIIPGGASSPIMRPESIDIPYDFDSVMKAGSMRGSGALMVFDEDTSIIELANRTIRFFNHESCGQCTPCREGTFWLKNLIRDFVDNAGSEELMQRVDRVAGSILGNTICAFGDAAGAPMQAFGRVFPEEFRKHFLR